MKKKLNNKGFTLVELLAVLVILIAIMSIAIPTISSSLDRSKNKQNKAKQKLLESAAELYVTDHKNQISATKCYIEITDLKNENYIDQDADEGIENGKICYDKSANTYTYQKTSCGNKCTS